jgi:RNA polymerase sigma-70 factor (ECF subfamily)
MSKTREQAIISEILNGDSESYRFLVERYSRGLIQHLYNYIHDEQGAEDIAQDAFLKAYDKLAQYNDNYAFSTWLYKIADNIAYRQFKQRKVFRDIDELEAILPDDKPSLAELTDRAFTGDAVQTAIARLPFYYQRVIALYYWEGCDYEDIAQQLERPVGTIRTWLYRAKAQLRKELYGQI